MLDLADVRATFIELAQIKPLKSNSGQKDVLTATKDGRPVVLKLIKRGTDDGGYTQREIDAVGRLQSGYVPKMVQHGQRRVGTEERLYIIEEHIAGETLRELLLREPVQPLARVLDLGEALLAACRDFEQNKLVHRDIKPENLMVDTAGKIWVIDFGIVRMLDRESLTKTGNPFGHFTLGYGAPEQVRNQKAQINVRADLFSVGVVMHETLNGFNPYLHGKADALAVLRHMQNQDLPRLTIPGDDDDTLAGFIAAMTARFPSRRPQTAKEATDWFAPISAKIKSTRSAP